MDLKVSPIEFIGDKDLLWRAIGEILKNEKYHYQNVVNAISSYVVWKKAVGDGFQSKTITESDIKSNMYSYTNFRKKKEDF